MSKHNPNKNILLCALLGLMSLLSAPSAFAAIGLSGPGNITDSKIQQLQKLHQRAEESILKNDLSSAIRIYGDILLEEPDDETAYTGLGQCYLILGDFSRAKNAYLNALHINPENETALMGLKKIEDPDSMNFTDEYTAQVPVATEALSAPAAPVAPPAAEIKPALKPAQDLNREQKIQAALRNAGFYRGRVDGIIGPVTRNAIRDFQKKYDLAIDGKVGPKTWELLQPFIHPNGFDEKT